MGWVDLYYAIVCHLWVVSYLIWLDGLGGFMSLLHYYCFYHLAFWVSYAGFWVLMIMIVDGENNLYGYDS